MAADDKTIHLTPRELEMLQQQAVTAAKVKELTQVMPEIFATLKALSASVANIPMEIVSCRNSMDKEMKEYMHNAFITEDDLAIFETKLETSVTLEMAKISQRINKASWVIGAFISAATFFNYLITNTNFFS